MERMQSKVRIAGMFAALLVLAMSADAQWAVVVLNPDGATGSVGSGVNDNQQVGWAELGGLYKAGMWSSTTSMVNLHPAGAIYSGAFDTDSGVQVGSANFAGVDHAGVWSGTAASWVDLHPAGAVNSYAYGVGLGQQVGAAQFGTEYHAGRWSGTAASWVDLDPVGAEGSMAFDSGGAQQAGYAQFGGVSHAGLWSGVAASWVDLHPAGTLDSLAFGTTGTQQVGYATMASGDFHASLWSGTAASWVDLHPAGPDQSVARDVADSSQVGEVYFANITHASLWTGTAASWVDLHAFLPPWYVKSEATAVYQESGGTFVVGTGYTTMSGGKQAVMWVGPTQVVTATNTTVSPGNVFGGAPANLDASDNAYYTLRPGPTLSTSQSPIVLTAYYYLASATPSAVNVVVESRAQQGNLRQTVAVYDYSTSSYHLLYEQILPTASPDTVIQLPVDLAEDYIGPGKELRIRVSYKAVGAVLSFPWRVFLDELTLRTANP